MPQMAPILWVPMMLTISAICLSMKTLLFFSSSCSCSALKFSKKYKEMVWLW